MPVKVFPYIQQYGRTPKCGAFVAGTLATGEQKARVFVPTDFIARGIFGIAGSGSGGADIKFTVKRQRGAAAAVSLGQVTIATSTKGDAALTTQYAINNYVLLADDMLYINIDQVGTPTPEEGMDLTWLVF